MKPLTHTVLAPALLSLALFGPLTALAAPLSKSDFQGALIAAMGDRNLRNVTLQGEQLKLQELQNISPLGAWRVNIISVCEMLGTSNSVSNQAGQVMRYQNAAVFANTDANFQFVVNSPVIPAHQRGAVEKVLTERLQTLSNEFSDLKAAINRQDDGSYQLIAQHDYGGNPSATARSRLGATLGNARFMMCDIHTARELADHERWKSLRNAKLGQLDRGTFVTLYPLLKESGYEAKDAGPEGSWSFKMSDELTTRVDNDGKEMWVWVYTKPPSPPDAARLATIKANILALPPSHGAARVYAADPNERGFVWAGLVFSYANMTGDEFADVMKQLIDKRQVLDFHKRVVAAVRSAY